MSLNITINAEGAEALDLIRLIAGSNMGFALSSQAGSPAAKSEAVGPSPKKTETPAKVEAPAKVEKTETPATGNGRFKSKKTRAENNSETGEAELQVQCIGSNHERANSSHHGHSPLKDGSEKPDRTKISATKTRPHDSRPNNESWARQKVHRVSHEPF